MTVCDSSILCMSTSFSSTIEDVNGKNITLNQIHLKTRRRKLGRARRQRREFDTDEELEAEAGSDSDSHFSDGGSATNSGSEVSDLEEGSSIHGGRNRVSSPPTPVATTLNSTNRTEENHSNHEKRDLSAKPPATFNWSDAVQDSLNGDVADLPVIDFADFRPEKIQEPAQVDGMSQGSVRAPSPQEQRQRIVYTRPPNRPSARQAYQQKLSNDPSFVPVVGEFWGHDDRLMDKELRSLSGWWRGRWQGRGRGGFGRAWDRGRGGLHAHEHLDLNAEDAEDVPPVDRTWSHDGFEELNKSAERQYSRARRGWRQHKFQPQYQNRGRCTPSTAASDSRPRTPINPTARAQAQAAAQGRPWFAKKPERIWTKQFDGFLYAEPELKSSSGKAQSIRIRLRSDQSLVVPLSELSVTEPERQETENKDEPLDQVFVRLPYQSWQDVQRDSALTRLHQMESNVTYEEPFLANAVNLPSNPSNGTVTDYNVS